MPTASALSFPVSVRDTALSCCSSGRACACVHKMLLMTALQRLAILTQSYLLRARPDCTSHSASQTLPLLLLQQWETHVPMLTLWARCILSRAEASKATGSAPWRRLGAKSFRQESHLDDLVSSIGILFRRSDFWLAAHYYTRFGSRQLPCSAARASDHSCKMDGRHG